VPETESLVKNEFPGRVTGVTFEVVESDLVFTGEGSLDAQTLAGKGPLALARLARSHGKPVWAFCGGADSAARDCGSFERVFDLSETGLPLATLLTDAARLLEAAASA